MKTQFRMVWIAAVGALALTSMGCKEAEKNVGVLSGDSFALKGDPTIWNDFRDKRMVTLEFDELTDPCKPGYTGYLNYSDQTMFKDENFRHLPGYMGAVCQRSIEDEDTTYYTMLQILMDRGVHMKSINQNTGLREYRYDFEGRLKFGPYGESQTYDVDVKMHLKFQEVSADVFQLFEDQWIGFNGMDILESRYEYRLLFEERDPSPLGVSSLPNDARVSPLEWFK